MRAGVLIESDKRAAITASSAAIRPTGSHAIPLSQAQKNHDAATATDTARAASASHCARAAVWLRARRAVANGQCGRPADLPTDPSRKLDLGGFLDTVERAFAAARCTSTADRGSCRSRGRCKCRLASAQPGANSFGRLATGSSGSVIRSLAKTTSTVSEAVAP